MITMTTSAHRRIFYRIRRRSPFMTSAVRLFPDRANEVIRNAGEHRPEVLTVMTKAEVRIGRHDRVLLGKIIDIVTGENRELTDAEWRRAIALRARLAITQEVRNA